jgi:hypothetical protein
VILPPNRGKGARSRAVDNLDPAVGEPTLGKGGQLRQVQDRASLIHGGQDRLGPPGGLVQVDTAARVTQHRRTQRAEHPATAFGQRLGQPAQLGLEGSAGAGDFTQRAAKQHAARLQRLPVDLPDRQAGRVIEAGKDILLAQPRIRERPGRLGVVDRQPRALHDRRGRHPRRRAKGEAVKHQIAVMIGKAHDHAIGARQCPGAGAGGDDLGHSRTSTTGTLGTSPALKLATETWMTSVSNRTGTSNSQPMVTSAPPPGGWQR